MPTRLDEFSERQLSRIRPKQFSNLPLLHLASEPEQLAVRSLLHRELHGSRPPLGLYC
jgi:hypothetical protein